LLAAHVAGDRYAFEELFHRHHRQLYRLAHITSRNPEDAADALQDAMLSAHRSAAAFRYDSAVSSWLYRIVVNACLDRLRRGKNNPTAVLHEDAAHVADPTPRVDTAIVIERALMRLPVEQRAAVVAVDMQGYSVAETARMLGVAEGTVKSRCSRAREKLAEALDYFDSAPQAGGAPSTPDAREGPRSVTMEPRRRWHRPITHGGDRLASERQHTGGGNHERRRITGHADHA
jgi:RNA polymerase sigma-70 factor (ECF subfamily)